MIAPQLFPLAATCGLVLAGVAVSLFTLVRAQSLLRRVHPKSGHSDSSEASAVALLRQEVQALQKQVMETRTYSQPSGVPAPPRPCLNLDKRSQALRMHRRGEAPAQIAAVLELPLQEVELLIKVHRIVLRSI
jgi:hypothetical protein